MWQKGRHYETFPFVRENAPKARPPKTAMSRTTSKTEESKNTTTQERTGRKVAHKNLDDPASDTELAAIDLRDALEEIPGRVDTEDLLGVIFDSFCIGK